MDILNAHTYIEKCLWIKNKSGQVQRLKLNPPQEKLYETVRKMDQAGKPIRIIILKARQEGFSTLTEALIFHGAVTHRNREALIVAHREDATSNLFRMSKRYFDMLDQPMKPMLKASNARELVFENPTKNPKERELHPGLRSRIRCVTAGGKGIGRSDTLQYVHISEYAFWPDGAGGKAETLLGILQAVPAEAGTMVVIESTANGYDDFKSMWDRAVAGENDFTPLFFAWFEDPEYRKPVPPGTEWTAEEKELQERYGLEDEQLAWRRWCISNNCGGDVSKFHQEYPSNAQEAFLHSGEGVFNNEKVQARLERCEDPIQRGRIEDGRWIDNEQGEICVYEKPETGVPYVIGGDTAGEGSDWFTGIVINNVTGKIAATLRRQYSEPEYVKQIRALGLWYNTALLSIEANFSTYPNAKLQELNYPKLYVREREDVYTGELHKSFGFRTTPQTRPRMIAQLVEVFQDHPEFFTDKELLREMLTFVYNEDHRPEAMVGKHDDMVMGTAIAYASRNQQEMTVRVSAIAQKRKWTQDMWDDYRNAPAEMRKIMLQDWGEPE